MTEILKPCFDKFIIMYNLIIQLYSDCFFLPSYWEWIASLWSRYEKNKQIQSKNILVSNYLEKLVENVLTSFADILFASLIDFNQTHL